MKTLLFIKKIKQISFYLIFIISFLFCNYVNANEQKMQKISNFSIDIAEVSIEEFSLFSMDTNYKTEAETRGWGYVYEYGWVKKEGWNWKYPFGLRGDKNEPAVHINYDEAVMFCKWNKKRIPTEEEWNLAAYKETRTLPLDDFIRNKIYDYPVGSLPNGSNCLNDCSFKNKLDFSKLLSRGYGHTKIKTTKRGVNGLYEMGANVWEWASITDKDYKATKGGSWWYGKDQMHKNHRATKPRKMSAVYIGFRCVKDLE